MMKSKTFVNLQKQLDVSDEKLALVFDVPLGTLLKWKSGEWPISGPVAFAMRLLTNVPRAELERYYMLGIHHTTWYKKKRRKEIAAQKASSTEVG